MAIMRENANEDRREASLLAASVAHDQEEHAPILMQRRFAVALDRASQLIVHDKAMAAWLLDGLARNMVEQWYVAIGRQAPAPENLFGDLKQLDEKIAWRLRHALRAPDADARLVHCRNLFNLLFA